MTGAEQQLAEQHLGLVRAVFGDLPGLLENIPVPAGRVPEGEPDAVQEDPPRAR